MSDDDKRSEYFNSDVVSYRTRLGSEFYNQPCEEMAKSLLGKILVRRLDDSVIVRGRIIETESYPGGQDVASHSFNGKVTPRNEPMFMKPGTAYVYLTYGMYHCFNISSKGDGAAVLLRSLEPLENLDTMIRLRKIFRKCPKTVLKSKDLCNGPAKLCMSFAIDIKSCNKQDLTTSDRLWVEEDEKSRFFDTIVCSPRIGIKCEKEWQDKFLRFYVLNNTYVSKLEKTKMNILNYSQTVYHVL
ncbi:DNA-3-methyladenine glycosylase-like [Sipha flava]|uniref:DNA-3-methyladenine glycosylase n=1 Tax=Sipha flava TaxID=143950 RepID=A0A2S2QNN6_9HEMI|nr:DNA-3-methyladenine glycosylase-like [Sipha flava]